MLTSLYHGGAMLDDAEIGRELDVQPTTWRRGLIQAHGCHRRTSPMDTLRRQDRGGQPAGPVHQSQPLSDASGWCGREGPDAAPIDISDGSSVRINPDAGEDVVRDYLPLPSLMWNNYTVTADVGGFAVPGDGSQAGISVLKPPNGSEEQEGQRPRVGGRDPARQRLLCRCPRHRGDTAAAAARGRRAPSGDRGAR